MEREWKWKNEMSVYKAHTKKDFTFTEYVHDSVRNKEM